MSLRRCFIASKRTLALQGGYKRELREFAPFFGVRSLVSEFEEVPQEPRNLLTYASVRGILERGEDADSALWDVPATMLRDVLPYPYTTVAVMLAVN